MIRSETKKSSFPKELDDLKKELFKACEWLRKAKDKTARKRLEHYINEIKIDLGWELLDRGDHERGLALYASLPSKDYGEVKCNGMSRALVGMKRYDEARQTLEKGLERFPQSYNLWVAMGAFHSDLGDDFEALECFEKALQYAPENGTTALLNKAQVLGKLGSHGEAVSILKELIQKDPRDPRYFLELGYCYLDMGYPEEALRYDQEALQLWEKNPTDYEGGCIYMGIYASYRTLGMLNDALTIAQEGLNRFPEEDPGLYQNMADAYHARGWRNDAIKVLKKGIKKFPGDEELKSVLKEINEGIDDPNDDKKPPLLGLIMLMIILRKKWRKK